MIREKSYQKESLKLRFVVDEKNTIFAIQEKKKKKKLS